MARPSVSGLPASRLFRWVLLPLMLGLMVLTGLTSLAGLTAPAGSGAWLADLPALAARAWTDPSGAAQALLARWQGLPALPLAALLLAVLTLWSATGIPGCSILLLAIGARYGLLLGTLMVTLATTVGALPPFLLARHGLRAHWRARHGPWVARVDAVLQRHGLLTLLALRLAPVLPYQLLNPVMGLSAMRTAPYLLATALGMAASSALYVLAGARLVQARSRVDLLDPALLLGLLALLLLAAGAQRWWRRAQGSAAMAAPSLPAGGPGRAA